MSNAATEITNLLYRYAELMDAGDFHGVAGLFEHARVQQGQGAGETFGSAPMLATWNKYVHVYEDGTPRTKHVITNPIVEIDEAAGTATCRSYYTVLQAAPGFALQIVCAGRYHDAFERVGGGWRFAYRDYSMMELVGDMSAHMLVAVG